MFKYYIYYFNIFATELLVGGVIIYFIKPEIISIFKALFLITSRALYIAIIFIKYNFILSPIPSLSESFDWDKDKCVYRGLFKSFRISRSYILNKFYYFLVVATISVLGGWGWEGRIISIKSKY